MNRSPVLRLPWPRPRLPRFPHEKIQSAFLAVGMIAFMPALMFAIGATFDPVYSLLFGLATAGTLYLGVLLRFAPPWAGLGATFSRKSKKDPAREYVITFNEPEGTAYLDMVDRELLQAHLDPRARSIGNKQQAKIVGALLGSLLAAIPIGAFLFWAGFPPEFAGMGALVVGSTLGFLPGSMVGKAMAPQPIWLMRITVIDCEEAGCDQDECAIEHVGYSSVIHRRFSDDEYEMTKVLLKGEMVEEIIPQIYRATTTYRMSLAKDAAEDYKGGTRPLEKIEVALVGMLALAALGLLALFAIVLLDSPTTASQPVTASTQQRSQ